MVAMSNSGSISISSGNVSMRSISEPFLGQNVGLIVMNYNEIERFRKHMLPTKCKIRIWLCSFCADFESGDVNTPPFLFAFAWLNRTWCPRKASDIDGQQKYEQFDSMV